MQREDLPEGYGGWQVLDPTPQERSSGRALLPSLEMGFFMHRYIFFCKFFVLPYQFKSCKRNDLCFGYFDYSLNSSVFGMLR